NFLRIPAVGPSEEQMARSKYPLSSNFPSNASRLLIIITVPYQQHQSQGVNQVLADQIFS
ncbi:MAG: hypothetical protein QF886_17740, partial [Planctomycetota bacterium]|nr:hypothetical protein [Planctomycetota bacterium]